MNKISVFLFIFFIFFLQCCKKNTILDETTEPLELYDYYKDIYGNEGIVFYLYNSKTLDLAIVISSDETELSWGPMGQQVYKADTITHISRTYSLAVLQQMFSNGIEHYPAQEWCNIKNNGLIPYSGSWRLPSQYEWELICNKSEKLNTALVEIGATILDEDSFYWTSTEDFCWQFKDEEIPDNDPVNRAIPMSLDKTAYTNKDKWIKEMKYRVRAIKYILYAE